MIDKNIVLVLLGNNEQYWLFLHLLSDNTRVLCIELGLQ